MTQTWQPSDPGLRFTGSVPWTLTLSGDDVELSTAGRRLHAKLGVTSPITIRNGWFWASVLLTVPGHPPLHVDGLPNRQATGLANAVAARIRHHQQVEAQRIENERLAHRRQEFRSCLSAIERFRTAFRDEVVRHDDQHRWFTTERCRELEAQRPTLSTAATTLRSWWGEPDIQAMMAARAPDLREALAWWETPLSTHVTTRNDAHLRRELVECQGLFDRVEKQPLTDEQRRAVVCMDSRVLTIAAAGSGKTSTMVAKAAYAVHRKLVPQHAIVMLAFNQKAAAELGQRVQAAFARVGLDAQGISAMTFHRLGSDIIGAANRRKRGVAPWVENDDVAKLGELIRQLRDTDTEFGTKWDLFRFVFGRDVPTFNTEERHEDWIGDKTGFRTVRGSEVVKSQQELTIANWLYYNGVDYEYEAAYEVDTATSSHRQYRPDFFYPSIRLYHEHFAIDAQGRAPSHFPEYLVQADWKRRVHAENGTDFIETRSAHFYDGTVFAQLAQALTTRGIALDPNPYRPAAPHSVLEDEGLTRVLRTFLVHAKSNGLTIAALRQRVKESAVDAFRYRHSLFLDLYEKARAAWDAALDAADAIDFEDMLVQSADHLEAGRWKSPYALVMVDEFQDASCARARMARGLVHGDHRHLFAVGDDWQSINRFAGADISVMTRFSDWFGPGPVLRLEQTFRCPQALCDASSSFVSKNPTQLRKTVRSTRPAHGPALEAFQVKDKDYIAGAVRAYLVGLVEKLDRGEQPAAAQGRTSVFVLGRYNQDRQYLPADWHAQFGNRLDVTFGTIHGSKGLEADYVVLPSMVRRGFPSAKQDDPVLLLAMPPGDDHPFAEERRLFYVALTRARRSVAMFTVEGKVSDFLVELMREQRVVLSHSNGLPTESILCTKCDSGVMVHKVSRYGPWYSCSNYPLCTHKFDGKQRNRSAR